MALALRDSECQVSRARAAGVAETAASETGARIPKPLADDLAFELREGGEHIEDEVVHGERRDEYPRRRPRASFGVS